MSAVPEIIVRLADMVGEDPNVLWTNDLGRGSLETTLADPEKLAVFTRTVEESLRQSEVNGISGIEAVAAALNAGGEAIYGDNRPAKPTPTEHYLGTLSPILLRRRRTF